MEGRFVGPFPKSFYTDPTGLRQILINHVGNAIKFTDAGSIRVVVRSLNRTGDDPRLKFDVIDTGMGIAKNQIDMLFMPFMQADHSMTHRDSLTKPVCRKKLIATMANYARQSSCEKPKFQRANG